MPGFPGFDCSQFPGLANMTFLKQNTNLVWCGYYLAPTPSHPGTSWMGQRAALTAQGWGIAPLYVGQQVVPPGSQHPSKHQGEIDGRDAANLMQSEGFPANTFVYLDLENGLPFPSALRDYVAAWVGAVAATNFKPGVYCSHVLADAVHQLAPSARIWAFKVPTTDPNPISGPNFPDRDPAGSGFAGAFIWQLGQNCQISMPGTPVDSLTADFDSALSANPGN